MYAVGETILEESWDWPHCIVWLTTQGAYRHLAGDLLCLGVNLTAILPNLIVNS